MNKTYIFFVLFFSAMYVNAQIVDIPDPNFKNALLSMNPDIDANNDGEIQVAEAQETTTISVNAAFIDDLTGIEAFVNITYLDCTSNNLTFIDVSNNTALEVFLCYENELTSIDISNNSSLFQFECRFNQLTSIDVNSNPNLLLFSMGNNTIAELDFSNNPILSILECRETLLENLDLSANSNLFSLICNNNMQFQSINLQNGNNENITFDGIYSSNFENLPILKDICIDDVDNVVLIDEITSQVGHAINFTENCTLGIEDSIETKTTFFPNPSSEFITIESSQSFNEILVYNVQGKLLKSYSSNTKTQTLNISEFRTGVYFFKVKGEETSFTKQIIKN
ncbi:T9SS type A sorting domain-containing protein [Patiriisocius sp. Uisw_017]|jgi:hypothetical protein|uniref:T9SS type A sorting domain-containing protein n=1 Tax=Patiriisocius sp. Uisw_017 TaxID=3230968 RepID=UPI0039E9CA9F